MATCEQPSTKYDLEKIHQSSGESLRDFMRRFLEIRNFVPNITEAEAIATFTKGLRHEQLCGKMYRKRPKTSCKLIQRKTDMPTPKKPNGLPAPLTTNAATITVMKTGAMMTVTSVVTTKAATMTTTAAKMTTSPGVMTARIAH